MNVALALGGVKAVRHEGNVILFPSCQTFTHKVGVA